MAPEFQMTKVSQNKFNRDPTGERALNVVSTHTVFRRHYASVGRWALFQQLLAVLRKIGDRHGGASIANVAVRWVLDHPFVGAVLVGA